VVSGKEIIKYLSIRGFEIVGRKDSHVRNVMMNIWGKRIKSTT
jgi:predicted RNA binding protein YcfA (HicA-like mRNA interferase family)